MALGSVRPGYCAESLRLSRFTPLPSSLLPSLLFVPSYFLSDISPPPFVYLSILAQYPSSPSRFVSSLLDSLHIPRNRSQTHAHVIPENQRKPKASLVFAEAQSIGLLWFGCRRCCRVLSLFTSLSEQQITNVLREVMQVYHSSMGNCGLMWTINDDVMTVCTR